MTLKLEDTGDCKQSCDSRLKLEVGKTYVDGTGRIVNISKKLCGFYLEDNGDHFRENGEWVSAIYPNGDKKYNLIAEHKNETRCPTCNALVKERAPVVHEAWVYFIKNNQGITPMLAEREQCDAAGDMFKVGDYWSNYGDILKIEKITFEERQDVSPATYEEK